MQDRRAEGGGCVPRCPHCPAAPSFHLGRFVVAGLSPERVHRELLGNGPGHGSACPWQNQNHWESYGTRPLPGLRETPRGPCAMTRTFPGPHTAVQGGPGDQAGPPLTARAGLCALRPRQPLPGRERPLTVTDSSRACPGTPSRSAEVDGRVLRPPGLDDLGFGPLHPFHLVLLLVLLLALAHVHHDAGRGVGGRVQLVLFPWP